MALQRVIVARHTLAGRRVKLQQVWCSKRLGFSADALHKGGRRPIDCERGAPYLPTPRLSKTIALTAIAIHFINFRFPRRFGLKVPMRIRGPAGSMFSNVTGRVPAPRSA